jgi:RNA polymerase sigma-70 factor (ECF subfamily)
MPEAGPDMESLVDRCRQGDEAAARDLLGVLHPLVLKLVRSHRSRRTAEEDLVQVVFMKVFAKLDQFSGQVPLEHWVSRIAVNTCLNQLKHEQVRPELRWADLTQSEEDVVRDLATTSEDVAPGQELAARDLVDRLLDRLPAKDRLLMSLLYLEEMSVAETARTLGWNQTLVKVRAFRARRRLQQHLEVLLEEPPVRRRAGVPSASALQPARL